MPIAKIVGIDEVGRGCLFGPVVAAAVILNESQVQSLWDAGLRDSKRLSPAQRLVLDQRIRAETDQWRLGLASVLEIDRLNILQAALLAMKRAVLKFNPLPTECWIDGNKSIPGLNLPQKTIVGGDNSCPSIAAASILAKVWRDQLMERLALRYPGYGIERHKGYGTLQHRAALQTLGHTPLHRRSFRVRSV
ncbi:MAG: ribonuclease HII [Prochlorotrichaceae cyanobacterium]